MIVEKEHRIEFFEVDFESKMTFRAMARRFQYLAAYHSGMIGAGYQTLRKRNYAWYLHRLKIQAVKRPLIDEDVRLSTWTKGMQRFKNVREYLLTSADGQDLVKGESVWLFYDLAKKRIASIPDDIKSRYENETISNFDEPLDAWQPCGRITPDREEKITLRYSDFDVNGHVNNTEYIGFFESVWHEINGQKGPEMSEICIRFNREVGMSLKTVRTGFKRSGPLWLGNIYDENTLFCDACITAGDDG